jgi:hypothetical protein
MPDDEIPMNSKAPITRTVKTAARLLATAAPAALMAAASPALADTTVSTATTTPLVTSAAGAVTVAKDGTIKLDSGTAVTVDASKDVTVQSGGTIDMGAGNSAAGIVAQSGTTSNISNAGTIQVIESFTPPDTDNNGIPEGPIAQATDRYGIRVAPGGTFTGTLSSTCTITIDGINSAGIAVDSALIGSVTNTGTIKVKGDNAVGIRTGAVSGNVSAGGTVGVVGSGRTRLALALGAASGGPLFWVDPLGVFFPPTAAAFGVQLDRLVLVRPPVEHVAWTVEQALRSGACPLVVLDTPPELPGAAARWMRAAQLGANTLCVITDQPGRELMPTLRLVVSGGRATVQRHRSGRIGMSFAVPGWPKGTDPWA